MTVIEAVRAGADYLEGRGVESARHDAEHLLAAVLECSRLELYLRFDERPGGDSLSEYGESLRRRAERYPLQYILGEVEFFSLPFLVREGVFVPRPETQLLVEWIGDILSGTEEVHFLEFGVGAGVISGSLAAEHLSWSGVAFDVSPAAAALARENFVRLGVAERVATVAAEGFGALRSAPVFDLLVANPPYIPTSEIAHLQREVSEHEERTALDGGPNGLRFYPPIAAAGTGLLRPGGLLALEIGDGQAAEVAAMLEGSGYCGTKARMDHNGLERMVTAFRINTERDRNG